LSHATASSCRVKHSIVRGARVHVARARDQKVGRGACPVSIDRRVDQLAPHSREVSTAEAISRSRAAGAPANTPRRWSSGAPYRMVPRTPSGMAETGSAAAYNSIVYIQYETIYQMSGPVKRSYDASRRQALARANRARMLGAARRQFLASGYSATTLTQIAEAADVSVQSINQNFGNKPGLLRAVFEFVTVGDAEPVPLAQRDWITAIHDEPNARKKLQMYARVLSEMLPRSAPIQLVIREAASDPAMKQLWEGMRAGRMMGMTDFATNLSEGGHLRDGVTVDHARDVLWTYSSPELYELLVLERGWTTEEYADFIEVGSSAALLPPAPANNSSRSRIRPS
jgi:AcrR family transcriptional regulator